MPYLSRDRHGYYLSTSKPKWSDYYGQWNFGGVKHFVNIGDATGAGVCELAGCPVLNTKDCKRVTLTVAGGA